MAGHSLDDVATVAVGPRRLADHTGQEGHIPVHGQQGAAGAHLAVDVGAGGGAAHFVGDQVGVIPHAVLQRSVRQVVESGRALEGGGVAGFPPAGDDGRGRHLLQLVGKISLGQAGGEDLWPEADVGVQLQHSQVVFGSTVRVTLGVVDLLNGQGLRRWQGVACGGARRDEWRKVEGARWLFTV